ncbi:RHS repeat domain-containing protein [Microbulbifer sp. SSSA007]|uniref:RHS repeat domain-containing protein n=1 Tax=Microbulbifer sp. SSSA007 TaxID=3243379 RepID=UPI0040398D7F
MQSTEKVFQYLDHLGSVDLLTEEGANVIQQMSFDVWGQRRNSSDWSALSQSSLAGFDTVNTTWGYTGHEMLDAVGLIHMNGRIYDPRLGRFMQADPFVQAAADTQMYNRYSYVRNNPVNATDPSGYFLEFLVMSYVSARLSKPVFSLFADSPEFTAAIQIVGTAISAYFCGPCSIAFAAHAAVGGITAELQGGKFGHGFFAAGFSAAASASGVLGEPGTITPEGVFSSAIIGGTASVITGSKFANGAMTGTFSYTLNHELHKGGGNPYHEEGGKLLPRLGVPPKHEEQVVFWRRLL